MKKKNIIIIISALAIVVIAVYFLWWKKRTGAAAPIAEKPDQPAKTPIPGQQPQGTDHLYPWKDGTSGPNVLGLQRALNMAYDTGLTEDGIFGPKTQQALISKMEIKTITSYDNRIEIIQILKNKIAQKQRP